MAVSFESRAWGVGVGLGPEVPGCEFAMRLKVVGLGRRFE